LDEDKSDTDTNLIDAHYNKLECKINWVEPNSETYNLIDTYVKNTHAKTHSNYSLEI